MSVKTVKRELEAKLTGPAKGFLSRPTGKVERKTYADGGERLKISLRKLDVDDGLVAVVKSDDEEIAQIPLSGGSGRLDARSSGNDELAELKFGQTITVEVGGKVLLSGKLHYD